MIFNWPAAKTRRAPYLVWHPHFALWPRRVGRLIAWLEWIERKGKWYSSYTTAIVSSNYGISHMEWKYREKQCSTKS